MATSPFKTSAFSAPEQSSETQSDGMEQLRSLIFGEQMKQYEDRFRQMEQSFRASMDILKIDFERAVTEGIKELKEDISSIRSELNEQIVSTRDQLSSEVAKETINRKTELGGLTEQAKAGFSNVQAALAAAETRQVEVEKKLQKGLADKTRFMHEEMQASVKNLTSYLDVQTRDLRENKLDKDDLSKALQFVAGGLAPKPSKSTTSSFSN